MVSETATQSDPTPAQPIATQAIERARVLDGEVRRFVVEHPVVAVTAAIAGGFLIGRLLSRS